MVKKRVEITSIPPEAVTPSERYTHDDVIVLLSKVYEVPLREGKYSPVDEIVFTILSQHTSDRNSERAFESLKENFGTMEEVAKAPPELIAQSVASAGLMNIKVPRIKQVLNRILELRGNLDITFLKDMPLNEARDWLKQLPGIGPKSAGAILCFSLGMPAMVVDTHIHRVSKRLAFIGPKVSADDAHDILEEIVEPEKRYAFHVLLITHGRQTCKAPRPLCHRCILAPRCPARPFFQQTAPARA